MNLKIESQKLISNLDYLRDWVRKSLDNIRINHRYFRLPQDDNSLSSEIKEAIRLALIKDNDFSDFTLKKHYDICEFSSHTRIDENTDTSQQFFMINFVNTTYQVSNSQQDQIQQLEHRLSKLDQPDVNSI